MELRERSQLEEAARYARFIVGWHAKMGSAEWRRRFRHAMDDQFTRYEQTVRRFHDSDHFDPSVQLALAEEQISGSMEWAYTMPLAEGLHGVESAPVCLGELARKLRDLASRAKQDQERIAERTVVQFSDREDLLAKARRTYSPVVGAEVQGAGGVSFLLSCSLERSASHADSEVVLLSPDLLGVRLAPRGREGDLLDQMGSDGLELMDVKGNSSP